MRVTRAGFFVRFRARVHRDEGGFTLIELMVALFILFIVMTSVGYTATIGFKYAAVARQRETAGGYAMKYYQESRALAFNTIKKGLSPALDPTYSTDTKIITDSATCASTGANAPCVKVPGVTTCGSATCYESLKITTDGTANTYSPQTPPLVPHQWAESVPAGTSGSVTTYTSRVYVTTPSSSTCTSCYRLVVVTSWDMPVDGGAATSVTYQSLMTNTSGGCLGTASHPYSGPCGPYLDGQAIIPQGTITITPNTSGGTSILNVNLGSAVISLPENAANVQTSQIKLAQALMNASTVTLGLGTSAPTLVGWRYLAVQADNDATLSGSTSQTANLSSSADSSGSVSAVAGSSSLGTTSASSCGSISSNAICLSKANTDDPSVGRGLATATVLDSGSSSCNGVGTLPCGYSVSLVRSGSNCPGSMSTCVVLHLYNGGTDLGTCTLVSIGAPATASSTLVKQTTGNPPVPEVATVTRNFGQVSFGCIPSLVTPPSGWNLTPSGFTGVGTTNTGFLAAIQNGYSQGLQAAAGVASPTTSATVSGTEWYYNPGNTTQAGGTLTNPVGNTSTSLTAGGTLSANLATAVAGSGTLAAALGPLADTFSALGTLAAAINSTNSTSIKVTESTPPPATPFVIKVDSEQMNVTARTNQTGQCVAPTYCYTVTRGYNGTTAATHSNGAAVTYRSVTGCPSPCSFNVDETVAPSTGTPFTIQIDSEKMQVTNRVLVSGSTYTYTATRAYLGTTAAAHSAGATVSEIVATCPTSCSFNVSETSPPPSAVPFVIQIDSEQMNVTSRVLVSGSTYTYTVTRAYNSTTATVHSAGATVSYYRTGCASPCSFNVTETATPPSLPFVIQVDSEQMNVTNRVLVSGSTYTYTVTRPYNGTTAAAHNSGATVTFFVPFGYSAQTDSSPSGTAMSVPTLSYTTGGCTYTESVNGGLASPSGSVANTSTSGVVTNSAGTLTAPLTGDFKFNVTCGGTTVADLDIAINLGTIKATATYSAGAA